MSLILKGIDLPKECRAVEIKFYIPNIIHSDNIYINGREMLDQEISALFTAEHLNDIIQIPKEHGRIGDFDLLKDMIKDSVPAYRIGVKIPTYGDMDIMDKIEFIPTILEAEE